MDALSRITIQRADPESGDVRPLIAAHLAHSDGSSPETSNHTMDVQGLKDPDIRFWTVSNGTGVVGCGALKSLPDGTAEVKSVHVARQARGQGLARRLMMALIDEARQSGIVALVLETGSMEEYRPARGLYQALGFGFCEPILGYSADPNSVFMRLPLDAATLGPQ